MVACPPVPNGGMAGVDQREPPDFAVLGASLRKLRSDPSPPAVVSLFHATGVPDSHATGNVRIQPLTCNAVARKIRNEGGVTVNEETQGGLRFPMALV